MTPAAAPSPAAAKAQAAAPSRSPHPPILKGITTAVWTTISSATSSPRGAVQPADPGRDDERDRVPGDDQHRGQHEPGPHVGGQQAETQVCGNGPGGAGQPRPAAASSAPHDQRGTPGYARHTRQNIRQRGPDRRRQGQQHDDRHHGLDDLTAQPFPRHRAQPQHDVSSAPTVRDRPVHVAENPAEEHGVEEQGTVVGADRAWQANADAECPGDDPPPPGRTHRSQGGERDGGHDRLPGDCAQPVLERRRAHLPPEKPQHGDAGGQAQQRRAETADGRTDPGRT